MLPLFTPSARAGLVLALGWSVLSCGGLCPARGEGTSPTAAGPAKIAAPASKAVFAEEAANGIDPFFPASHRRSRVQAPTPGVSVAPPSSALYNQLVLKGISRGKERRLALINNVTVAEGEKAQIKLSAQPVTLECLKVLDRSVLVCLDGSKEPRELELRKGF